MARTAHFKVIGRLDHAARVQEGTLSIDRDSGVVTVRPKRRRKVYLCTLDKLADMIVQRNIIAERLEKARQKAAARRARRGR